MFKVTHGKVKFKGVLYGANCEAGDTISGLSPEKEESLASKGYGEIIKTEPSDDKKPKTNIPDITGVNVKEGQKLIEEIDDLETLKAMLKSEEENDKRKGIIDPLKEKIEELEAEGENQDVNVEFDPDEVIEDGE